MIIDIHGHIFAKGWIPPAFFHGIARFVTHEFEKQGVYQTNEEVGDSMLETSSDPEAEMLLEEMEEAGIDKTVIFPVDLGLALGEPELSIEHINKNVADLGKKHPDKLIPFATMDPRRENALSLFEQCVQEWGMRGLKLHPTTGFYPNQKEVYPLLEKASEWKIPVLIHTGFMMVPLRAKYSQIIHLDDLAVDFPDLPIIAAHAGGSYGYREMLSLMGVKLNILVDISSWQILAVKNFPLFCKSLRELIDFSEPERVFFGTDTPSFRTILTNPDWVDLLTSLPEKAPDGIVFKEEEMALVMGGNAQKLLNIQ